jgi:hypothetical protein
MRKVSRLILVGVGIALWANGSQAEAGDRRPGSNAPAVRTGSTPAIQRVAQVKRHAKTDATFSTGFTADGAAALDVSLGDTLFKKRVYPDGRLSFDLVSGKNHVTIAVANDTVQISNDRKNVTLDFTTAGDDQFLKVRELLANSKALRQFRRFTAALEASDDEDMAVASVLVSSALVGMLDGDLGAPERIGRRLTKKQREGVRNASMVMGCYANYEAELMTAWNDMWLCIESVSALYRDLCGYRWVVWVESAWFAFLRCTMFW